MLFVKDVEFHTVEAQFKEAVFTHASTSPNQQLIASLDVARKQAVMEGYKLLSRTLELAKEVRQLVNSTRVFRVLELEDLLPEAVRRDGIRLGGTDQRAGAARRRQERRPARALGLDHALVLPALARVASLPAARDPFPLGG